MSFRLYLNCLSLKRVWMHTLLYFIPSLFIQPVDFLISTHLASLCPLFAPTITLSQLSVIVVLLCFSSSFFFLCRHQLWFFLQPAHEMSVLSLTASLLDYISSSSCLNCMWRHCLVSSWSDSLLAWCLEQLSNLINSIIRPLLLPGCFTRVWAPEAEWIQGLWPNGGLPCISPDRSVC